MKMNLQRAFSKLAIACLWSAAMTLTILLAACASTSVKNTWKSPGYKGAPPQKIAVVTDDDRAFVRVALESRFVNQLNAASQPAFATSRAFPDLAAARKNKEATVAKLRADGAEAILLTRLVSKADYVAHARQNYAGQYSVLTVSHDSQGWDTSIGSYSTYSTTPRSDDRSYLVLDTSLFELNTGQRIWGCVTEVTVKETDDRLEIADKFVAKVVESLRQDGMIR
jgi:hypothetical protein